LQVAENHARTALVEQGDLLRDHRVAAELGRHRGWALGQRVAELEDLNLSVRLRIARHHHQRAQFFSCVVRRERHERSQHRERRLTETVTAVEHRVIRLEAQHARVAHVDALDPTEASTTDDTRDRLGFGRRCLRHAPRRVTIEEQCRVVELIAAVHVGLHAEEIFWVTEVLDERRRCFAHVGEQIGERLAPRRNDRVVRIHHVERHVARERINDGFHTVAHVVKRRIESAARRELVDVRLLGVRVPVADGVRVEHPTNGAVNHHRVRVGVVAQERCKARDTLGHVAIVDDARLRRDEARAEQVVFVVFDRISDPTQRRRKLHAAGRRLLGR